MRHFHLPYQYAAVVEPEAPTAEPIKPQPFETAALDEAKVPHEDREAILRDARERVTKAYATNRGEALAILASGERFGLTVPSDPRLAFVLGFVAARMEVVPRETTISPNVL